MITRAALALCLLSSTAMAQSQPNWVQGYVPLAPEWNALWASKQDKNSSVITTPVINGGSINGSTIVGTVAGITGPQVGSSRVLPTPRVARSTLIPTQHLAKFLASATPTVCLVGDSMFTVQPDMPITDDTLAGNLARRINQDSAGLAKTITYTNFAIGAQTWNTFNAIATANWPAFYFNHALAWMPYVQAANCTSLYISFSINDANGFTAVNIQQALQKVVNFGNTPPVWASATVYAVGNVVTDTAGKLQIVSAGGTSGGSAPGWATVVGNSTTDNTVTWQLLSAVAYVPSIPDIVLLTGVSGNPLGAAQFATQVYENGTIAAASYDRTFALSNGNGSTISSLPPIGLIDIGRYFTMGVYGFDPVTQASTTVIPPLSPLVITTFPTTLPTTLGGDYEITYTIANGSGYTSANQIQLQTGCPGGAACTYVTVQPNGSNANVYINSANGIGGIGSISITSTGNWLAGTNTINIALRGETVKVTLNGIVVLQKAVSRFVANLSPTLNILSPPVGATATVTFYSTGTPMPYAPIIDYATCFGGTSGYTGGNGLNHNASQCINAIDVPVLEATRFVP